MKVNWLIVLIFQQVNLVIGDYSQLFCDFETDLCSWRHEVAYTNGLKWSLSEPDGQCAYGDAHCPYSTDRYLYSTSRVLTTNGSFVRIGHYPLAAQLTGKCTLSLKYIAHGIGFAKLVIGIRMVGDREPEPILVIHSSKDNDWRAVKIPLVASYVFTPVIEAIRLDSVDSSYSTVNGFVAIDDTLISDGCLRHGDSPLGDPISESNGHFDSPSSSPMLSRPAKVSKGSRDKLRDMITDWRGLGKLPRPVTSLPRPIFTDQPEDKDEEGKKSNSRSGGKRKKKSRFKAYKSVRNKHPICSDGLDDDDGDGVRSGTNPLDDFNCETTVTRCSENRGICDFKMDCEDGSDEFRCPSVCDLDSVTDQEAFKELCGWSQTRSGTRYATWVLISGSHASKYFQLHPLRDATAGTVQGKYLILNLVDLPHLPSVHLNSPTFYSSRSTCYFTFSYIIYDLSAIFYVTLTVDSDGDGASDGKGLSVLWKSSTAPSTTIIARNKMSTWKNASAYIGRQSSPFFLTFSRSAAPFSSQGTVALDNLQFNAC